MKLLGRALMIALGVLAFVLVVVLVAVNLVLTKERLTPLVEGLAAEYLDANVTTGGVEATFFRTFPRVGVRITDGCIVSHAFHRPYEGDTTALVPLVSGGDTTMVYADTVYNRRDTLVTFGEAVVGFNLLKYLMGDGEISLGYVRIDNPVVRLLSDSAGRCSWDIVRPDTDDKDEDADTSATAFSLHTVVINNCRLAYFDRGQKVGVFSDSIYVDIDGDMSLDDFDIDIDLTTRRTSVGVSATRYVRRMPIGVSGRISYDGETSRFVFDETLLSLASTDIDVDGWLSVDTAGASMNIEYALNAPSADKLFASIPKDLVSAPVDIKQGKLDMKGTVIGRADADSLPVLVGNAYVENIRAQYEGRPKEIEDVSAKFDLLLDCAKPEDSHVNLDIFHFKGGETEVSATVRITELLAKALFNCDVKAHVDFNTLGDVIPFDGVDMEGVADITMKGSFRLEDMQSLDLGKINLNGRMKTDTVIIRSDAKGFRLKAIAESSIRNDGTTKIGLRLPYLHYDDSTTKVYITDAWANGITEVNKDTARIATTTLATHVRRAFIKSDTVAVFAKGVTSHDKICPTAADKRRPRLEGNVVADTIFAGIVGVGTFTKSLNVSAVLENYADTLWHSSSSVAFDFVKAKAPFFAMPITMEETKFLQENEHFRMEKGTVKVGSSTVKASGAVKNLFMAATGLEPWDVELNVEADTVDVNQLVSAVIVAEDKKSLENAAVVSTDTSMVVAADGADKFEVIDSVAAKMLLVPKQLRFQGQAKVGTLVWNNLKVDNIRGHVQTNDGALHITDMFFRVGESRAMTTLAYKAWPLAGKARLNLYLYARGFDISDMVGALELDTLLPVLKPMRGKLDCYMGLETELDTAMTVNLPVSTASVHLGGKSLTVLDNETFASISKKLLFKNKKQNLIDTLSVNVLLDSGRIQVLPFITSIDRYKMVIGGSQDLDMNLNYHVSILKSPLPFKAGVNVKGNIDDVDIDITTAKLKKMATDEVQHTNDSIAKRLRNMVIRDSYVMSGLPVPEKLRKLIGDTNVRTSFSVSIEADEETEEARRDAEMARRMQESGQPVEEEAAPSAEESDVAPADTSVAGGLTARQE